MDKKIPLIIDCDPGHDDAIALMLACKSDKLDLKGVTVVAGNQTLDKTVNNALRVLNYAGMRNIPVAAGFDRPLLRKLVTAPEVHGESGIDGAVLPRADIDAVNMHAIDFIADIIRKSDEKITIAPLGPLTNIAVFIRRYPELIERIERISLMGGSMNLGNITPSAEYNISADPEAAHIVFTSGIPITMAGLDVTHKAVIFPEDIFSIRKIGNNVAIMIADLLDYYCSYHFRENFTGCHLHDPVAITWLIRPEIIKTLPLHVDIELNGKHTTGSTIVDYHNRLGLKSNADVCLDIDREEFVKILIEAIRQY